jgi:hypothetical protein
MIILPQDFKIETKDEHILYSQIKNSYVEEGIALNAKTQIKESPIEKIVVKASSTIGDKAKARAYFEGQILFPEGKSHMIFYNDLKKMFAWDIFEFNDHEEFSVPDKRDFPTYAISNLEGIIVRSKESTASLPEFRKDLRNFAEFFEVIIRKIYQISGKKMPNGTLHIGPIMYGRFSKEPIIPEDKEDEEKDEEENEEESAEEKDSCGIKFTEEPPKFRVGSAEMGRKK